MLITFKNLNKNKENINTEIINPILYLLSKGNEGIKVTKTPNKTANLDYITVKVDKISSKYSATLNNYMSAIIDNLIQEINTFLKLYPDFIQQKNDYYHQFSIPKKKPDAQGRTRWRKIIEPEPNLKALQQRIVITLRDQLNILPHNAAHAFTPERSYYTNALRHQNNNHIINLDLKDFFDSITEEILYENLMLHPIFCCTQKGKELAEKIVTIATYNGTTPQGSPLSPFLSNIIMINFDYCLRQELNQSEQAIIYTRYADDMTFSSKRSMDITKIIHMVENILNEHYHSNIKINYEKTKKIIPGRCFITGVKLNKKHDLTVGWEKKKVIKSRIYNLYNSLNNANVIYENVVEEFNSIMGYLAFMNNIESGYTDYIKRKYSAEIQKIIEYINYQVF